MKSFFLKKWILFFQILICLVAFVFICRFEGFQKRFHSQRTLQKELCLPCEKKDLPITNKKNEKSFVSEKPKALQEDKLFNADDRCLIEDQIKNNDRKINKELDQEIIAEKKSEECSDKKK